MSTTSTIRTGIDASALSDHASANYGGSKRLYLQAPGTATRYAYVWFNVKIPKGSTVLSATLHLFGAGGWGSGTKTITAQRIAASWKESLLTWNAKPGVTGATATLAQTNTTDATEWAIDVAALVQTIVNAQQTYGFRLSIDDTTARQLYSTENATYQPYLRVTWVHPPDVPTTLKPDGGRAVSITKPTLGFDFHDVNGSEKLAAVQVQIKHGSADFTTPTFDSGTVLATEPELDLSTTAYAGTTAGTNAYWRVRVQDSSGLWSPWSDAGHYTKANKYSLNINNPPSGAGSHVSEPTPPITWTFAGAGGESPHQTAWRIQLYDLTDDSSRSVLDTKKRSGSANSYTLPAHKLDDQGATYRVYLDVWDDVDREATPGDPQYVRLYQDFTYAEDPTPNPVTALAVAQVSDRPQVRVTWQRSTAPDAFAVARRVGSGSWKTVAHLDPADANTSDTSYGWTDRAAWPYAVHSYKVQAVVNGKSSMGNPTASIDYVTKAVWLADPDTDALCPIHVTDSAQFDMPEVAGTYEPVNANAVVRVTQMQRGLQGELSGRVVDYAGRAAADWVAQLVSWKKHPTNELLLIIGAQTLHVVIGNVVLSPLAGGGPDDRAVSFSFWSLRGVTQ